MGKLAFHLYMDQILQRETGLKQTLSLLQKISEYDIPKEQIKVCSLSILNSNLIKKRTKISKVIVRISKEKSENEEEIIIIKLVEILIIFDLI